MLLPARVRGICHGCQYGLLISFERGFCTTTKLIRNRSRYSGHTLRFSPLNRNISSAPRLLEPPRQDVVNSNENNEEQDAVSPAQAALLRQLETELGKPLEDAIREDEISAEQLLDFKTTLDTVKSQEVDKGTSGDRVATLRSIGAPVADVVREARLWHGDTLPDGILNEEEFVLYKRLYGQPAAKETAQTEQANRGPIPHGPQHPRLFSAEGSEIELIHPSEHEQQAYETFSRSFERRKKGQKDLASYLEDQALEEDEYDGEENEDGSEHDRSHPLTAFCRFKTTPRTVFLPQEGFVKPVEKIMGSYSNKHLKEMCEKTFGGPGLPDSPLTPRSGRSRQQIPIPLSVSQNTMGEMEANAYISTVMPPTYASIMSVLVETRKRLGISWLNRLLSREGGPRVLDAGGAGIGIIAWREIVRAHWNSLHVSENEAPPPPASKSVVLTGSDGLRHRAAEMLENTTFVPRLPDYVHTRDAPTLEDNRPAQQRKQFDIIIAPHALFSLKEDWMRKQYVQNLWTMLSDEGGILILIEKGVPRGFEAIAGAREMLLDRYIAVPAGTETHYSKNHAQQLDEDGIYKKESAMIIAPCTNHERCPMYTVSGLSRGRKDICSFQQRYIRPAFLQRVLEAKDRNHDDVDFSYLSVMKGDDLRSRDISSWADVLDPISAPKHSEPKVLATARSAFVEKSRDGFEQFGSDSAIDSEDTIQGQVPTTYQMPRILYPPIKRRGHVTIDLCTPAGKIERWTVPRSYSKQAYRDARKSKWGDIWALGAKTRIDRNLKLGTPDKELVGKDGEFIKGKGRGAKERLKIKAMKLMEQREEEEADDLMEQRDLMAQLDEEFEGNRWNSETTDRKPYSSDASPRPRNNRERKALKRAARAASLHDAPKASSLEADGADLTFKPKPKLRKKRIIDDDESVS